MTKLSKILGLIGAAAPLQEAAAEMIDAQVAAGALDPLATETSLSEAQREARRARKRENRRTRWQRRGHASPRTRAGAARPRRHRPHRRAGK